MTPPGITQSYRVLVIDDNLAIHEDFRKVLGGASAAESLLREAMGALFHALNPAPAAAFQIDCAAQGEEGLALLRAALAEGRPYSVAFVDGRMPPGWDGIETIIHLWRDCPDLQVVICTAYADYSWDAIRRILGATDNLVILKKPFDNIEVLQLAHALAKKWDLNRQVQGRLADLDRLVRERTEQLQQVLTLFEASLAQSPAGILIAEAPNAAIRWANQAGLEILGKTGPPVAGVDFTQHSACGRTLQAGGPACPPEALPLSRAVLQGETTHNEEIVIRKAGGQDRWVSANAAPVRNPAGVITAGIVVFQDITERKRADESMRKSLVEKEILIKEVHHRVKNNLQIITSLLQLQARRIDHPTTTAVLGDMQNRVMSMALVHEHLYRSESVAGVDLAPYLKSLCEGLFRSMADTAGPVKLQLDLAPAPLGIDQAIPCGLLVNELVSNALKHAFPARRAGQVRVELQPVGSGAAVRLRVSDDGAGLPADLDVSRLPSLGLKLVSKLAGQLGGELNIQRGNGTVFEVVFSKSVGG